MEKDIITKQLTIRDELKKHLKGKAKRAIRIKNNRNKKNSSLEFPVK